jgi:hypothetical protein
MISFHKLAWPLGMLGFHNDEIHAVYGKLRFSEGR